jgi:PPK2 family polyphosphate:nucleotide phosphotransferase
MSFAKAFRVEPGKRVDLTKHDPRDTGGFADKEGTKADIVADAQAIDALQTRLYAQGKQALLVILQGMDCSGKDGTARSVFNACGPIGVTVTSFKAPSPEELSHDYLWRIHQKLPPRGFIGLFNRSQYEDVLAVKVRKLAPPEQIEKRYEQINNFEKLVAQNGTRVLKFMLNISKDEQKKRLEERVADETKRWKFNPSDLDDRALWGNYMSAYEEALSRCSTSHAPWHIIPADRNWVRNAIIGRIVRETLEEMNPQLPKIQGWDPKTIKIV